MVREISEDWEAHRPNPDLLSMKLFSRVNGATLLLNLNGIGSLSDVTIKVGSK
jgi:hypothetical protein